MPSQTAQPDAAQRARSAGLTKIWLDPGIGFGKSALQCAEILRSLRVLKSLGAPLYVGASRKSFIGTLSGEPDPLARLPGSLAAAAAAFYAEAAILRVHDVAATRQFLTMLEHCSLAPVDHV